VGKSKIKGSMCADCEEYKPRGEFGRNRARWNGLKYRCRSCEAAYTREYRKTPKAKMSAREYNRRADVKERNRQRNRDRTEST